MVEKRLVEMIIFYIILILILLIPSYFIFFNNKISLCNDGTIEGECSNIKPYLCINGTLTEKASICGCFNSSELSNDKCLSIYQIAPKNITLNYTLMGKEGEINFTVYQGLYNYTSILPRYLNVSDNPTLLKFEQKKIDNSEQRELLLPLVIAIENSAKTKEDQVRIAISIVQNIPFGNSTKTILIGDTEIPYQRYPYEVLYDMEGVCSEKSELLVFLLREIGYDTSFLYYAPENHEAVGIKCPPSESIPNSSYCFVETTGPSIITDDKNEYLGGISLTSIPYVVNVSSGISLGNNLVEYKDAKTFQVIRKAIQEYGAINFIQHLQYQAIKTRYGLPLFRIINFNMF